MLNRLLRQLKKIFAGNEFAANCREPHIVPAIISGGQTNTAAISDRAADSNAFQWF
jgi:hypothetical protein